MALFIAVTFLASSGILTYAIAWAFRRRPTVTVSWVDSRHPEHVAYCRELVEKPPSQRRKAPTPVKVPALPGEEIGR